MAPSGPQICGRAAPDSCCAPSPASLEAVLLPTPARDPSLSSSEVLQTTTLFAVGFPPPPVKGAGRRRNMP